MRHITMLACALFAFLSIVRNHDTRVMPADELAPDTIEMVQAQNDNAEFQIARKANSLFRAPRTIVLTWNRQPTTTFEYGSVLYSSTVADGRRVSCVAFKSACRRVESRRSIDRSVVLHNLRL